MMQETPVFQPSIVFSKLTFVSIGVTLGIKVAIRLAILYVVALVLIGFSISLFYPSSLYTGDLRDFGQVFEGIVDSYFRILLTAIFMILMGGFPAAIIGAIGGGIIGYIFSFFRTRFSPKQAVGYGFLISLILLVVRIVLPYLSLPDLLLGGLSLMQALQIDLTDLGWWIFWYAPNIGAFFGFWWVAYQLNEQMPTPSAFEE